MLAVLELEFIGENYFAYKRMATVPDESMERFKKLLGRDQSRPWVAHLTGLDRSLRPIREFVRGQIDYNRANGTGSRGVYLYFHLSDGLYEVNARESWSRVRRYFIRVENAAYREISREEALQCLSRF